MNSISGYLFLLTFLISTFCFSQAKPHDYYIRFTDRANSPYSLSRPEEFLSARALERRKKQAIPLEERDLPVNPSYVDSLRKSGAKVLFTSKWFNAAAIETQDTTGTVLQRIRLLSFVDSPAIQLLRKKGLRVKSTSGSKAISATDQANSTYGYAFRQVDLCNGESLNAQGFKGKNMLIAIIDAGFLRANKLYAFRQLRNENRIIATHNFVDSLDVYSGASHGMYVLSTMAGYLPGKFLGVAPDAAFLLLESENDTSEYPVEEDAWVAAAEFADSAGADLINSSLGYTTFDNPFLNNTYSDLDGKTLRISEAANIASRKGIIVMNSAGNSGAQPWHYISAPADAIDILTVGAVDSNEIITYFSSRGPSSDGRIKPDVCAMGRDVVVADTRDSNIFKVNGTSLSSPIITGLTACLWQAFPDKSNKEIMQAIRMSGNHAMAPDNNYGYGIPDYGLAYRLLKEEARLSEDYLFDFAPNPFTSYPHLDFYSGAAENVTLTITDMAGRIIYTASYSTEANTVLNKPLYLFESLPYGMYLASLHTKTGLTTRKLIKD